MSVLREAPNYLETIEEVVEASARTLQYFWGTGVHYSSFGADSSTSRVKLRQTDIVIPENSALRRFVCSIMRDSHKRPVTSWTFRVFIIISSQGVLFELKKGLTFPLINLNPKFFNLLFRNEAKSSYRFSVSSLLASKFDGFSTSGILNIGSTFLYPVP